MAQVDINLDLTEPLRSWEVFRIVDEKLLWISRVKRPASMGMDSVTLDLISEGFATDIILKAGELIRLYQRTTNN